MARTKLQNDIFRVNSRIWGAANRSDKFGTGLVLNKYQDIIQTTEKATGVKITTAKGLISSKAVQSLPKTAQRKLMGQLSGFSKEGSWEGSRDVLQANKNKSYQTIKKRYGIDLSELPEEDQNKFWDMEQELKNKFGIQSYDEPVMEIASSIMNAKGQEGSFQTYQEIDDAIDYLASTFKNVTEAANYVLEMYA